MFERAELVESRLGVQHPHSSDLLDVTATSEGEGVQPQPLNPPSDTIGPHDSSRAHIPSRPSPVYLLMPLRPDCCLVECCIACCSFAALGLDGHAIHTWTLFEEAGRVHEMMGWSHLQTGLVGMLVRSPHKSIQSQCAPPPYRS